MTLKDLLINSVDISYAHLHSLIDGHSIFAVTDTNGIITHANEKFVELSKYSKRELIGENHSILRSNEHSDEFFSEMWDRISSKKIWHGDIKNKAKDGSFYWLKTTIIPLVDTRNSILGYAAIRTDITKQKKHQELLEEQDELMEINNLKLKTELLQKQKQIIKEERMSSIGHLASRMAHDIRNPLSIIKISIENVQMLYGVNKIQIKQFERIERSIDRINHQIDGVLDFVKGIQAVVNRENFSEILDEAIDSLNIPNYIKLILPKNDFELLCDKKQLAIALNNLILNSIQAMAGPGTIEITIEENSDGSVIKVMDSGDGIPEDHLDDIFEPLFTTKQQGTGLGLASVKAIVDAHGGKISVTSPPVIFTITLPRISD